MPATVTTGTRCPPVSCGGDDPSLVDVRTGHGFRGALAGHGDRPAPRHPPKACDLRPVGAGQPRPRLQPVSCHPLSPHLWDGREVDLQSWMRFFDLLERRDGGWRIVKRTAVYEKDRLDPVDPRSIPKDFFARDGSCQPFHPRRSSSVTTCSGAGCRPRPTSSRWTVPRNARYGKRVRRG